MSNIKDLIENPHQIYKRYRDLWLFLLDSYEGGADYCKGEIKSGTGSPMKNFVLKIAGTNIERTTTGNLFVHPKERDCDYLERIRMSYYYNFCSPIIDIYTDHLFKQSINENFKSIDTLIQERRENIDNKNGSIGEFRKEMSDMAQIYGHIFVITDSPQFAGQIYSMADVIENGLLPYFTLHHPQNVINWALDPFGSPYWVLIRETFDFNIDPLNFDKESLETTLYRLWTRQEWILFNSEYNEIGRGTHGLGIVPITCVFDKQSKKFRNFLGISSIADIAFIARDIYNSCSELKQILRDQTFAVLAIQGNASEYDELSVGTSKGLLYPEGRNVPQFVSPPSTNAETYFKHIDRQVSKIFQLAKLEGGSVQTPDQSAVMQSGVSKAWDFNQTNSALSKKASNLEDGEMKLWSIFAKFEGKEFDGSIQYPNEFSIQSLNEDLEEAEKIMRLNLGTLFNQEIKQAIIKKKFPRMGDKDIKKMIDDMKAKEETMGETEGSRLLNRVPSLFKQAAQNANFGG